MTEGYCKPNMNSQTKNIVNSPGDSETQEAANGCLQVSSHGSSSNNHKSPANGVPSMALFSGTNTTADASTSKLHTKLISSSKVKELSIHMALDNLKNMIKQQNKIITGILTATDHLRTCKKKTKSPVVADAIDYVINSTGNLKSCTSSLHSAYYEAEKASIRGTNDQKAATDAAVPVLEDTRSAVNELRVLMEKQGEALGELTQLVQHQHQHQQDLNDGGRRGTSTRNSRKNKDKPPEQYDAAENDNIAQQLDADRNAGQHDDNGWEMVQKKNAKRPRSHQIGQREEVRTRNRSDVVIVQTKPENYSEVLKKIKSGVNMEQQSLVEFRGLDSLTNIDELVEEIVLNANTPREAVKVLSMRKLYGETQSALVLMPWDNAAKITNVGRIRVGLVYCSTRLCKKRKRCFRCLKFGHESSTCSGPDKSNCCRRCGVSGHLAAFLNTRSTTNKMINFLQINLNCCKAAQALVTKTADDLNIDIILVCEQNQACDRSWIQDQSKKSAIINHSRIQIDEIGKPDMGFTWCRLAGTKIYSCYWTPRPDIAAFTDLLRRLETSIRASTGEVIVCGDFNAHHTLWGCCTNDKKGDLLADMIQALGMVVCNKGTEATFQSGNRSSIVDVTFATQRTAASITKWVVLEETSLSDHNYVHFCVEDNAEDDVQPCTITKVVPSKLKEYLDLNPFPLSFATYDVDALATRLSDTITQICGFQHRPREGRSRRSVYWWSLELSSLRKDANHLRRVHKRKRKKSGWESCLAEAEAAKTAKAILCKAIKRAKEKAWADLCDQVQRDPWGKPYKLVMGKLCRNSKIPGINTPGRAQLIIQGLFPVNEERDTMQWPQNLPEDAHFTITELRYATSQLKNSVSPGPDRVPNEAMKILSRLHPEVLLNLYNKCIDLGRFPKPWKRTRLVLLRKDNKPLDQASSYRPLCLLDSCGKLFEKLLDNRIREHLEATNGLADTQYGFRKGRSTIHAVHKLMSIVNNCGKDVRVGVLTLDIKNAFNSASWNIIMREAYEKDIPPYLCRVLDDYLRNRKLQHNYGGSENVDNITSGVPQGSVLGPTLWNILYDRLLRETLPVGVQFIAYADDLAIIGKSRYTFELEKMLSAGAEIVRTWLSNNGLQLAIEKSEAIILTNTRVRNDFTMTLGDTRINGAKCIKYLGIYLETKLNFTEHANHTSAKAGKVANNLARILPNISAATPKRRRLLANAVHSIILYGAPIWAPRLSKKGEAELAKVQRRVALRVASAYCTVSYNAIQIIADMPPIVLIAIERQEIFENTRKEEARKKLIRDWQLEWDTSENGRWTHRLIPKIDPWFNRTFGEVNYRLTQALSGHGCFPYYLHRFGKLASPSCWYCGHQSDDAYHTFFVCGAWHSRHTRMNSILGREITPENMTEVMRSSKDAWTIIDNFVNEVLRKKEEEERRRKTANHL
ncbi:hypothetical protein QTP88_001761 [Uroleucon formosanum]